MKNIYVHIPELLNLIEKMANENMEIVKLTINDQIADQNTSYPAFLYFEACTKDGFIADYDSIDSYYSLSASSDYKTA